MDKKIIDLIQNNTKSSYRAKLQNGILVNNICNIGIKKYQRAEIGRKGEYKGLMIEALSDSKHLFTDYHIIRALDALYNSDINKAVKVLDIESDFVEYGHNVLDYIIKRYLTLNNIQIPDIINKDIKIEDIKIEDIKIEDIKIEERILTTRNDPIKFPFKIIGIGHSTKGNAVVPEHWIGKFFRNGDELHREIDKLDWRKGKPQVHFCCTHGMILVNKNKWMNYTELINHVSISVDSYFIAKIDIVNNKLKTSLEYLDDVNDLNKYFKDFNKEYMISNNLIFVVNRKVFLDKPSYIKTYNIGLLASRLQKCIRRGPGCSELLYKTIYQINKSPSYNLSDQHFIRVSGTRQLLWRSFISIIEDACGFNKKNNEIIDLLDILLLAIICNIDPDLQLTDSIIEEICYTLLIVQSHNIQWNWQSGEYDNNKFELFANNDYRLVDSMQLALQHMPMMYSDRVMLSKCLYLFYNTSFNVDSLFDISKYISKLIKDLLLKTTDKNIKNIKNIKNVNELTKLVSYDMHCCPNILLSIQARIPFIDSREKYTTHYISKFIWENSSGLNYRNNNNNKELDNKELNVLNTLRYMQQLLEYNKIWIDYSRYPDNFLINNMDKNNKNNMDKNNKNNTDKNNMDKNNTDKNNMDKNNTDKNNMDKNNMDKNNTDKNNMDKNNMDKNNMDKNNTDKNNMDKNNTDKNNMDKNNTDNKNNTISRLGFLLLFGKKYKLSNPSMDVIIAGTKEEPCKIKKSYSKDKYEYLVGINRVKYEKKFIEQFVETIYIPKPPLNYEWINLQVNQKALITAKILKSNNSGNKIIFRINDIDLNPFDTSKLLRKINENESIIIDNAYLLELLFEALYLIPINNYCIVEKLIHFAKERLRIKQYKIYDWLDYGKLSKIKLDIWRQFYCKVMMNISMTKNDRCEIIIGPVDRNGNKTHNFISYEYEGIFIRLLCLMSFLYPLVIEYKSELKFKVNLNGEGIQHMLECLYDLTSISKQILSINKPICIKTTLWDHQKYTVDKIFEGMTKFNKLGFGDASHVGAGKTLTALSLMSKLNILKSLKLNEYNGFLVMVPTEKLYKTWEDEINKHSEGFIISFQESNGNITREITENSILITTMGRMRDHPIIHPWILTVIDECLTIQNKEALQTEEAWRQVILSKYGVLMMSATFFRSRFDKMFYMLKMLRTGLPETPEYLDTILSETMVCNITSEAHFWTTNVHKYRLSNEQYKIYDNILKDTLSKGNEKTYNKLQKYIFNNCNYIEYFKKLIDELTKFPDRKILIYSKSKEEADNISKYDDISRYPDKTKKHIVLSYAEGTFGLNDLIKYNTIITRIPDPDKIPQMKGRLDRPGQTSNNLYLEYILLENTIEEASLYKLELANMFRKNHILPLAKFYEIALNNFIT